MKGAGWKSVSMVDVKGKVTFTVWLCGCNLRCPFCHNWRLAENDPSVCSNLDIKRLADDLASARGLVDFFHVTGGEPLMQADEVVSLFRLAKDMGFKVSLNSNLTMPWVLTKVLGLIDHVATDVKLPEFYGYDTKTASFIFANFLRSLDLISGEGIELELRVPLARGYPKARYEEVMREALKHVRGRYYVVENRLLGPPLTDPRDKSWCEEHCYQDLDNLSKSLNARTV